MKNLASLNYNVLYKKNSETKDFSKHINLIIILDEAEYIYNKEGAVIRDRKLEKVDFMVPESGIDKLIEFLKEIKNKE
jgi:hypothetical protein